MVLTNFVRERSVRDCVDSILPKYPRQLRSPSLVESRGAPSLIGTAFDYAFRFELSRYYGIVHEDWVSIAGLDQLEAGLPRFEAVLGRDRATTLAQQIEKSRRIINQALAVVAAYRRQRNPTPLHVIRMARYAIRLARIDAFARSIAHDKDLFVLPTETQVDEVIALLKIASVRFPFSGTPLMNPKFGDVARRVGGADADLIIDDTLVEIKATQAGLAEREMVRQLVGYFFLCRAANEHDQTFPVLKRLALYFARQGVCMVLSTEELLRHPQFLQAEAEFWRLAKRRYDVNRVADHEDLLLTHGTMLAQRVSRPTLLQLPTSVRPSEARSR